MDCLGNRYPIFQCLPVKRNGAQSDAPQREAEEDWGRAAAMQRFSKRGQLKSAQNGRLSLVRYATSRGARDIHRALGAEGLEMNQSEPWSMAMLAEIYMLRLEAAARAAKETARFIPIALPV